MNRCVIFMLSLLVLGSVACTAVSTPTPTTQAITADVVTVPPRPSATATVLPTEVFVEETAVIVPSSTTTPQPTATVTLLPTPTPRNLPELIWFNEIEEKVVIDSRHSAWSPVKNEILFDNCSFAPSYMLEPQTMSIASAPNFEYTHLNLAGTACPFITEYRLCWRSHRRAFLSRNSYTGAKTSKQGVCNANPKLRS